MDFLKNFFNWKNGLTVLLGTGEILNAFFPTLPPAVCTAVALFLRGLFKTNN